MGHLSRGRSVTLLQFQTANPSLGVVTRNGRYACHLGKCDSDTAYRRLTAENGVGRKYLRVNGLGRSFLSMPHTFRPTSNRRSGWEKPSQVTAFSPRTSTGLKDGNRLPALWQWRRDCTPRLRRVRSLRSWQILRAFACAEQ